MTAGEATGTCVRLQVLTYVDEAEGVMVGRPDTGSYGVFPPEGAQLLRSLAAGTTLETGAQWWQEQTGEQLDIADFLAILDDLGFVVADNEARTELGQVRWRRLARVLFSPPLWILYAAVIAGGVATMIVDPNLRPSYRDFFFTNQIALIPLVLALLQMPLLLIHEGYHALAARRLGLPSKLGIGRRFYYLVAETRLNSLYSVPRAQRYLPFLAGSLIDAVGVGVFTIASAMAYHWGAPPWVGGLALALAFSGVLRVLWQFLFYLETDLYFVINTATRCDDLHGAGKYRLRAWQRRVLHRPALPDGGQWSDRDLAAARWYAPVIVVGYGFSLLILLLVALPAAVRFFRIVVQRLDGAQPQSIGGVIDTVIFVLLSLISLSLLGYVTVRDLRRSRASQPSQAEGTTS
ncbi:MAG TPA: hypothetical protein VGH27_29245 [Streptosporangiaceae bacterium]|jgi:hypothetical protein